MQMNTKKILAAFLATIICLAVPMTAIAATVRTNDGIELLAVEESSGDNATTEAVTNEENLTTEATTDKPTSADETTTEASKDDVIALLLKFLGTIKLDEVKDSLNDINEALGLPRVETFADMAAYADALYEKLEALGLGYDDIINAIGSSDLIEWLNGLIFGKGDVTTTTAAAADDDDAADVGGDNDESDNPHTGAALATTGAAIATLAVSTALAFVLKKRENNAE